MRYPTCAWLAFSLCLLTSCSNRGLADVSSANEQGFNALPGTIEIGNNLFYDQTEITNLDWREYLYWQQKVYGEQSYEVLSMLPAIASLPIVDTCASEPNNIYLNEAEFQYYPVVGISLDQAKAYSQWRADRVMEMLLIKQGFLEAAMPMDVDSFFSIARLLAGKITTLRPLNEITYYPEYRLPTAQEWQLAMNYAVVAKSKTEEEVATELDPPAFPILLCDNLILDALQLPIAVARGKGVSSKSALVNLNSNPNELSNEPGIYLGESWCDQTELLYLKNATSEDLPSPCTGFRNIATWKSINRPLEIVK